MMHALLGDAANWGYNAMLAALVDLEHALDRATREETELLREWIGALE
jgi:hypothetical protein